LNEKITTEEGQIEIQDVLLDNSAEYEIYKELESKIGAAAILKYCDLGKCKVYGMGPIFKLRGEGCDNKEIAEELNLTEKSVENIFGRIRRRFVKKGITQKQFEQIIWGE
jgi:hypothetical protein